MAGDQRSTRSAKAASSPARNRASRSASGPVAAASRTSLGWAIRHLPVLVPTLAYRGRGEQGVRRAWSGEAERALVAGHHAGRGGKGPLGAQRPRGARELVG